MDVDTLGVELTEIGRSSVDGAGSDRTNRVYRRGVLQVIGTAGPAGVAGCLGSSDNSASNKGTNDGDDEDHDEVGDDGDIGDDEANPENAAGNSYYREELENAMEHLNAPDPGTGVVVFENDGEYRTKDVVCEEDIRLITCSIPWESVDVSDDHPV